MPVARDTTSAISSAPTCVRSSWFGLSVALENPKAKKLYERSGYRVDGAPYCDVWYYTDAQGIGVRVEEHVLDLVKDLSEPEA